MLNIQTQILFRTVNSIWDTVFDETMYHNKLDITYYEFDFSFSGCNVKVKLSSYAMQTKYR